MTKQIDVNARNITVATAIVLLFGGVSGGIGGIGGSHWRVDRFTGSQARQMKVELLDALISHELRMSGETKAVETRCRERVAQLKDTMITQVIRLDGRIDDLPPPLLQKQVDRNTINIGRHKENQVIHGPHREAD